MINRRARYFVTAAVAACLWLPAVSFAQSLEATRARLSQNMAQGHQAIGYSAAYDALADLHQDPTNADNILLFYTNRSQDKDKRVNSHSRDGWNREHLWPQSHGARREPMKSDLHHLMPADATVNSDSGSLDFDEGGAPQGEAPDTFRDADSFEPRDEIKGDVARALFYMDVRYEGQNGDPDLVLVEGPTGSGTSLGRLCTLVLWHESDPVDDLERRRNTEVKKLQGNTNLFIEEPELVGALFGRGC